MIDVRQLSKAYRDVLALDAVSFQIAQGEVVGLVGKNGAGKSTTLRILSGQLLPSGGDVRVDGRSVVEQPLEVRRRIGYLPEVPPLYPEMTPRGFLNFAARLRGLDASTALQRTIDLIGRTGLESVADRPMRGLSRGFQQRVGIAQALVHNPPVVLLDEPMAGLDPFQIVQIRELIRSLKADHTILFSSHILAEITNVCDRIIVIDKGQLKAQGSEAELRETWIHRRALVLTVRGSADSLRQALVGIAGLDLTMTPGGEAGTVTARILAMGADPRERISRACLDAGLGLLELRAEGHGLEELFLVLLGSAGAPAAAGGHA